MSAPPTFVDCLANVPVEMHQKYLQQLRNDYVETIDAQQRAIAVFAQAFKKYDEAIARKQHQHGILLIPDNIIEKSAPDMGQSLADVQKADSDCRNAEIIWSDAGEALRVINNDLAAKSHNIQSAMNAMERRIDYPTIYQTFSIEKTCQEDEDNIEKTYQEDEDDIEGDEDEDEDNIEKTYQEDEDDIEGDEDEDEDNIEGDEDEEDAISMTYEDMCDRGEELFDKLTGIVAPYEDPAITTFYESADYLKTTGSNKKKIPRKANKKTSKKTVDQMCRDAQKTHQLLRKMKDGSKYSGTEFIEYSTKKQRFENELQIILANIEEISPAKSRALRNEFAAKPSESTTEPVQQETIEKVYKPRTRAQRNGK